MNISGLSQKYQQSIINSSGSQNYEKEKCQASSTNSRVIMNFFNKYSSIIQSRIVNKTISNLREDQLIETINQPKIQNIEKLKKLTRIIEEELRKSDDPYLSFQPTDSISRIIGLIKDFKAEINRTEIPFNLQDIENKISIYVKSFSSLKVKNELPNPKVKSVLTQQLDDCLKSLDAVTIKINEMKDHSDKHQFPNMTPAVDCENAAIYRLNDFLRKKEDSLFERQSAISTSRIPQKLKISRENLSLVPKVLINSTKEQITKLTQQVPNPGFSLVKASQPSSNSNNSSIIQNSLYLNKFLKAKNRKCYLDDSD